MTHIHPQDTSEPEPVVAEDAEAAFREGMERAHELVSEAKLLMRQLSKPAAPVASDLSTAETLVAPKTGAGRQG
ncbi:MAG: hypothetical protein ACXWUP_04975 [Allosphingosinicella sp.]